MTEIFHETKAAQWFTSAKPGETNSRNYMIKVQGDITTLSHKSKFLISLNRGTNPKLKMLLTSKPPTKSLNIVNQILQHYGQGTIYKDKGNLRLDSHNPNTWFDPTEILEISLISGA